MSFNRTYAQTVGGECLKTNAPNQRYECHLGIPRMAFAMIHTVDFLIGRFVNALIIQNSAENYTILVIIIAKFV